MKTCGKTPANEIVMAFATLHFKKPVNITALPQL